MDATSIASELCAGTENYYAFHPSCLGLAEKLFAFRTTPSAAAVPDIDAIVTSLMKQIDTEVGHHKHASDILNAELFEQRNKLDALKETRFNTRSAAYNAQRDEALVQALLAQLESKQRVVTRLRETAGCDEQLIYKVEAAVAELDNKIAEINANIKVNLAAAQMTGKEDGQSIEDVTTAVEALEAQLGITTSRFDEGERFKRQILNVAGRILKQPSAAV
eukprot:TRINITY_DN2153_c0_g1_i4.p1 TRINITY_DN2153_c0_g1~~TRINITY_DN2153_c0_g1_i4.p1  ORF type:complete len:220 (-),score=60.37 TRINITY_DN2153_c0_g1_i4:175-834(-)